MSIQTEINRISGNVNSALSAIADKGVSVPSGANSDDLAGLIAQVESGIDTSDATAAAGDILSGKTAYVNGAKVTGTIKSQAAKTVTPSTSEQTAVASGVYTTGEVKVAGDANLIADNIKSGVSIFGVAGAFAGGSEIKTGTFSIGNVNIYANPVSITGLGGQPKIVFAHVSSTSTYTISNTNIELICITNINGTSYGLYGKRSSSSAYVQCSTSDYKITYDSDGFTIKSTANAKVGAKTTWRYVAIM